MTENAPEHPPHPDLDALLGRIEATIAAREAALIAEVEGFVAALAAREKITPEALWQLCRPAPPADPKSAPDALKYLSPFDNRLSWSGRGKPPQWYGLAIEVGYKEQQLINPDWVKAKSE